MRPTTSTSRANTRFWHASGIDVSLSATGLTVETQSLLSILVGGIAFETPRPIRSCRRRGGHASSRCSATGARPSSCPPSDSADLPARLQAIGPRARARRAGRVPRHPDRRGHGGQRAGRREDLRVLGAGHHPPRRRSSSGSRSASSRPERASTAMRKKLIESLVAHGVRAQLRTGQPADRGALRGARLLSRCAAGRRSTGRRIPRSCRRFPGQLEGIEANVASIIKKLDEVPLKAIGEDLRKSIGDLDQDAR